MSHSSDESSASNASSVSTVQVIERRHIMAGIIEHMEPFDKSCDQWTLYIELFEHYFLANDIQAAKNVSVLLSVVVPKTYGLLRSLVAPGKPGAKTYEQIVTVLQTHFSLQQAAGQLHEFYTAHRQNQGEGQTVAQYVAVLKRLSEHCEFRDYLEDALRDRFVCGLKTKELTFQKAVEHAVLAETAAWDVQQLSSFLKVNAVFSQSEKCRCCEKANHTDDDCWYKDCECHQCGRKGNESEGMKSDSDSDLGLYAMSQKVKYSHVSVMPSVNGKKIEMEFDSGAAVPLIPWEMFKRKLRKCPLQPTEIMLKTYTGEPLAPEGVIKMQVELNKQRAVLPLYVVKVDAPPLFGREWLRAIKLNWRDLKTVQAIEPKQTDSLETVLKRHSAVFSYKLGIMKGVKARLTLRPKSVPKFCPPRNVPYALQPRVETELKCLTEVGVISPVAHSDWATPVVPVNKKDGTVRLCGDCKVTLNPALCIKKYPIPCIEDLFASLAGGQRFSKLNLSNAYLQMEVEESSKKLLTISMRNEGAGMTSGE
ncbi:hypothetical protein ACEWY4_016874 [Coilia grayii]|uniref:Polyprotein n=1 Tax=Coilia grayii TaxID=363190 RepID=A0ABD1JLM9_9TELE